MRSRFTSAHEAVVQTLIVARREAGLLQSELAARLGKHQSYVSNIERKERRIDVVEFRELALAMGVDPVALFGAVEKAIRARDT